MKLATFIEISLSEFWEMDLYELNIYAESYAKRKQGEIEVNHKLNTLQAYQTSRWVWGKRLEQRVIDEILKDNAQKEMSDNEMLKKVKALNAMFGGEVKKDG